MTSWRKLVDRASRKLLLKESFYGHLLVGLVKSARDEDADYIARITPTTRQCELEFNPARVLGATESERVSALRHELVHLALSHPLRSKEFSNTHVWGMACDLVVNQLAPYEHDRSPLLIQDFEHLEGFEREKSADYYYKTLLLLEAQCRHGTCDKRAAAAMDAWRTCHADGSHERWADFSELSSARLSLLQTNLDELLKSTVKRACRRGWGPLPNMLISTLAALGSPPELPWRRLLRLFVSQTGRTYVKNTIQRASRRYGTVPGTKIRRHQRLTVAVDTSGSVSDKELATFFEEIYMMWRRGVTVTILEVDARVARTYAYRGVTPAKVGGRGGTSFDPAIEWSNENKSDGLVYFTDGFAPAPAVESRCPILWVLCSDTETNHLPGRHVRIRV